MGEVYRARQIALDKKVALKVMHAALAADPSFADRFHQEARAASRLDHPNSIRVIDFGEEPDGLTYIAMEYVEGSDLHDVIQDEWPLSAARIANILIQVASALAVAHDMGVVHRDLKPQNIMIVAGADEQGRRTDIVKVLDFGIAKLLHRSDSTAPNASKTTAGLIMGTPEYMSPEQGRGEPIDARTDIYSVGVILFELLTRSVPFSASSPLGTIVKHVTEEAPNPGELNPAVDVRLESICLKALRKEKDERYQTAGELRAALRSVLDEAPVSLDGHSALAATLVGVPGAETEPSSRRALSAPQESGLSRARAARAARAPARGEWLRWLGLVMLAGVIFSVTRVMVPWLRERDSPASTPPDVTMSPANATAASARTVPANTPHSVLATATANAQVNGAEAAPPGTVAGVAELPFQPSQASASVRVTNVTGSTDDAVKAALPLGSYKDCYRNELRRTKRRLAGHADLKVAFMSSGSFSSATGLASPELSKVGQCCAERGEPPRSRSSTRSSR